MTKAAVKLTPDQWRSQPDGDAHFWRGRFEGGDIGADVTVLFFSSDKIGAGPVLHRHPYDEVFIIRRGCARFTIGSDVIDAKAGDILMGPANVPHKFENLGPETLETTDIHLSATFIQTDLEGPGD